jgi:hypothetical protein
MIRKSVVWGQFFNQSLPALFAEDEAGVVMLLDRPWWREAAERWYGDEMTRAK